MTRTWKALGPDLETVFSQEPDPLRALAEGHISGIVIRDVYPAEYCQDLIRRFLDKGLMRDPVNLNPALEGTFNEVVNHLGGYTDEAMRMLSKQVKNNTKGDIPR